MAAKRPFRVGIIGGRDASVEGLAFAESMGRLLAEQGIIVYTGGAGGIMEAASKGAAQANGITVGILKENDLSLANEFIQIPVMTGMGDLRNGIIIRSVQAAIAVEGSYGTLSEIAYTLGYEKVVLGFKSWDIPGVIPVSTPAEALKILLHEFQGVDHA